MSRRSDILYQNLRNAYLLTRDARKRRNSLRDDYAALLADANAALNDYQAEQDDALVALNARLVLDGQPEITLNDLKDLP